MMKNNNIAAIILAAGYSSRMGDFKPLLKFGEYTAVETAINTFIASGINNIIVVVGHRGKDIINVLKSSGIKCVENSDYSNGMYSSILKGLEMLDEDVNGFFMLPVDVPLIKKQTIGLIRNKYEESNRGIIYPSFNGKKGHPPFIDCKYKNIIMNYNGDGGLAKILSKLKEDSIEVAVFDKGTIMDMDTKEDYIKLLKYSKLNAPSREECHCILNEYNVSDNIIKHCVKVSEVALNIIGELNIKGCNFEESKMEASALLHDIGRNFKNHAKVGEEILVSLGYEHIGNIISTHMDIKVNEQKNITENEILYLADKLVKEDEVLTLEDRFSTCLLRYRDNPEASEKINKRYTEAKKIEKKVEKIIGKSFNYE